METRDGFMQNDLVRLGEIFKKNREEKNISLKEVENATSIRISFLQAIEEGQIGKLISPLYAQGFIKKYAAFLEVDGDKIISNFPTVMRLLNEKLPENSEYFLGIGTIEVRGTPGGEVKWLPNLLWVGGSALVLLVGWFLGRYFDIF